MKTLFTFLFLFAFAIVQADPMPIEVEGTTTVSIERYNEALVYASICCVGLLLFLAIAVGIAWHYFSKISANQKAYKVSLTQLELAKEDLGNTKALLEDTKLGLRDQTKALDIAEASARGRDLEITRLKSSEGGLKESLRICSEDLVRAQGELEALQVKYDALVEDDATLTAALADSSRARATSTAEKTEPVMNVGSPETPAKPKASGRTRSTRKNK